MQYGRGEIKANMLAYDIKKYACEVGYKVQGDKDCDWLDDFEDTSLTYKESLWKKSYTDCPIMYKYLASYDFHEKIILIASRLVGHSRATEIFYNLVVRIIEQEQQNDPNWKRQIEPEDDELNTPFSSDSDFGYSSARQLPREMVDTVENGE